MNELKEKNIIGWSFDNSYARLPSNFYTFFNPSPVKSPEAVIINFSLASSLGLNEEKLRSVEGIEVCAGNRVPEGAMPIAQAYAGHQFGYFTILGDGRAILIGEQITPEGNRFDIQLKGSGRTPYSRGGDGRAVLGPMLREYIISEAMNALGIPTTRSLAVVSTGEYVYRDTIKPGAVLTRVAKSHIRVGTFEYAASQGTKDDIKILADYTIQRHFPYIYNDKDRYLLLLKEVVKSQAYLIAKWMLVGFVHGVMNTDNVAISGETIDYGPCAFMDIYDPDTVFSSIDYRGRYAYERQPKMAAWNLARFSETLLPLISVDKEQSVRLANEAVLEFNKLYHNYWLSGMREKLGLFTREDEDESLINELLNVMKEERVDFTNTFRALSLNKPNDSGINSNRFDVWYDLWESRLNRQKESKEKSLTLMKKSNPAVIPRNHRVEDALQAAEKSGDVSLLEKLLNVLECPYEYSQEQEEYKELPPLSSCPYKTFCGT